MNYQIVKDEEKFNEFVEFLPALNQDECYYVCLFARKKYHPSAMNDKSQCKRFVATSKEWLVHKVRQLEIKQGMYTNKNGTPVHEDSLALYININPRSFKRAQKDLLVTLTGKVVEPNNFQNVNSLSLSVLQKAKSRTCYVDFDFDTIRPYSEYKEQIREILNDDAFSIINTRGGFHILVSPSKIEESKKNSWYNLIVGFSECDVAGDNLIPFVGCGQGDFVPELME